MIATFRKSSPKAGPDIKSETISPDKSAELEREKRIQEQELRDKALREKALQEERAQTGSLGPRSGFEKSAVGNGLFQL